MKNVVIRAVLVGISVVILSTIMSCGGGGGSVTITVTPATATVAKGATQQFAASNGSSDITASVTWSASSGSITAGGLYSPPTTLPADNVITVTATLGSDSGTATVTLTVGSTIAFTNKAFYTSTTDYGVFTGTQSVAYDETNHIIYTSIDDVNVGDMTTKAYVYKSSDSGVTFLAPAGDIVPEGCVLLWPQMIIDSTSAINIVYGCLTSVFSLAGLISQDGAAGFDPITVASITGSTSDDKASLITDSNNNIYLVEVSKKAVDAQMELNLQKKTAGATEYQLIGELDAYTIDDDDNAIDAPTMALLPNGNLYIMYTKKNDADNNRKIMYVVYNIGTGAITGPIAVSSGTDKPINMKVVVDSSNTLHLFVGIFDAVDGDYTAPFIINYATFTEEGGGTVVSLASTQEFELNGSYNYLTNYSVAATIDGLGNIALAYCDVDGIYFMRSTDGGVTWSSAEKIVSDIVVNLNTFTFPKLSMTSDSAGRVYLTMGVSSTGIQPYVQYFGIGE